MTSWGRQSDHEEIRETSVEPCSSKTRSPMTGSASTCPEGHLIPMDAPMGVCPTCMFGAALEAPNEPTYFADYELLRKIDRGGMGVVFEARKIGSSEIVALKRLLNGELASEAEVVRFHGDFEAAQELAHPNVVPVYERGEEDGRHYFTMQFMEGGCLADHIKRYRQQPREAAELVETIAKAVHYGHERGILHRDLKPANILLDGKGKPFVADFGLAKHIDKKGGPTRTGIVMGTVEYMSYEQVKHGAKAMTILSDVYGLGVILFQLLTGECPFDGDDDNVIIQKILKLPAPDPRTLNPHIDLDLAIICLRCLEKDPADRYRSADHLAQEIRRYLNGERIAKVGYLARTWSWCKRRPLMAALMVEAALLLVVATLAVFSGAAAQEKNRREEVLRANEYAARWVAGTVLFKLNGYRDAVAKVAREFPTEFAPILRKGEAVRGNVLEAYCDKLGERHGTSNGDRPDLQDWFIVDKWGTILARASKYDSKDYPYDVLGLNYGWRDYFKGAWKLAEARSHSAYISRAILSEPNQTQRYVIAAPIYDETDEPIGAIITTTYTGAALGTLELEDPSDKRHIAMIVAPRDNDRNTHNQPLPEDHVILIHDALAAGVTAPMKSHRAVHTAVSLAEKSNPDRGLEQLLLPEPNAVTFDENFCDPVMDGPCEDASGKPKEGRWLAGFAPIGNTGFVAIVETPRETAAQPNQTLLRWLLLWGVLPFMVGTAVVAGIVGIVRRRQTQK